MHIRGNNKTFMDFDYNIEQIRKFSCEEIKKGKKGVRDL